MGKFLVKTFGFVCISLGTICLLNIFLMSGKAPGWGRHGNGVEEKIAYVLSNQSKVTTAFIGSSRVRHHIVPKIFDSITNEKSINLGYDAMHLHEVIYLTQKLLENDSLTKLRHLVIEMADIRMLSYEGTILENKYWLDLDMYQFLNDYVQSEKKLSDDFKDGYATGLDVIFSKRILGLGMGLYYWPSGKPGKSSLKKLQYFEALDGVYKNKKVNPPKQKIFDTHKINVDNYVAEKEDVNILLQNKFSELDSLANEKGINLYFLIQPLSPQKLVIPSLVNQNFKVLDMRNHKGSYEATNYFDGVHYNGKGARSFTEFLSIFFLKYN